MNSIDIFPWNDHFNTGLATIDSQHQCLVRLLNRLAKHIALQSESAILPELFEELSHYANYHFQSEEAIWQHYLSDDEIVQQHKGSHLFFLETLDKLKAAQNNHSEEQITKDALAFLAHWLFSHIIDSDRYLALSVLALQSGMTLDDAKQTASEQMGHLTQVLIDIILVIFEKLSVNALQLKQNTERRQKIEKELRKNQELMFSLLRQSPISVRIAISAGRKISFTNNRYNQLINIDADQLIGSDPGMYYVRPQDYDRILEQLNQGQTVTDRLIELLVQGGGTVWTMATYLQIAYENDVAVLAWFYDVTAIRKTEAQLHFLTTHISDVISRHDLEGHCLFVSAASQDLLIYTPEEMLGRSCYEFIYSEDQAQVKIAHARAIEQPDASSVSYRLQRKDGSLVWVESVLRSTRDNHGQLIDIVVTTRDITERKQIESRLRTIIETEPECIKILDTNGHVLEMNPAGLQMIEADSISQVLGMPALNAIASEYREAHQQMFEQVLAGNSVQLEFEMVGFKGTRRWIDTHAVPMIEADGQTVILAVSRDITERKQHEQQLCIAASVFESQQGMMVTDANNIILRINKAFTDITGYNAADAVGKNPNLLKSGGHDQAFFNAMWKSINSTGKWEGEIWNRCKLGQICPHFVTISSVKNPQGVVTNYVSTLIDITQRKASDREIERLAFYDPLTELPNRRLLYDRLKLALASSHRSGFKGALLFIDLDNFKILNDTYGHDRGDLLLKKVAERLLGCIREGDTVARLGGDEFVVMLEDLSLDNLNAAKSAKAVGNKILELMNLPFQLGSLNYLSTPSIGATLFTGQEQPAEELLKCADIAMYQAKNLGRNALCFFDPHMQHAINERVALEEELRKAIYRQQFELFYQIQVQSDNQIIGAEALIRWQHPERGAISPAEFIPLAEETGLIVAIGHWVLETACAQLKLWEKASGTQNLVLSVNVSPKQFFQIDFVQQVQLSIHNHAINPHRLKLELTESTLLENIEETIYTMNALREMGIRFSLDDFGTGYSSLQYLKRLPLDQLKIDQSFTRDLATDANDQAIVRTIIAMTISLNLDVIAEGVETEQQRHFLIDNGCLHFQGYLFGKPLPIHLFLEKLLQTNKPQTGF